MAVVLNRSSDDFCSGVPQLCKLAVEVVQSAARASFEVDAHFFGIY
jgi:hypothetical protein